MLGLDLYLVVEHRDDTNVSPTNIVDSGKNMDRDERRRLNSASTRMRKPPSCKCYVK